MSREVEKVFCQCCESEYKILYEPEKTSGLPKFCPFCCDEVFNQDSNDQEDLEE
jgi:hypothetical protein